MEGSMKNIIILIYLISVFGCASNTIIESNKKIVDVSYKVRPEWILNSENSWKQDDKVLFKLDYTINGNQRINACYELARLGLFEQILHHGSSVLSSYSCS